MAVQTCGQRTCFCHRGKLLLSSPLLPSPSPSPLLSSCLPHCRLSRRTAVQAATLPFKPPMFEPPHRRSSSHTAVRTAAVRATALPSKLPHCCSSHHRSNCHCSNRCTAVQAATPLFEPPMFESSHRRSGCHTAVRTAVQTAAPAAALPFQLPHHRFESPYCRSSHRRSSAAPPFKPFELPQFRSNCRSSCNRLTAIRAVAPPFETSPCRSNRSQHRASCHTAVADIGPPSSPLPPSTTARVSSLTWPSYSCTTCSSLPSLPTLSSTCCCSRPPGCTSS